MNIWELIIQQPLTNVLIVMTHYLANDFGIAIIILTIIVNLLMLKLTLSQIRSAKAMQDLQPQMAEIQKKYGKDRQKLAQEQMRLYRESGVKPAGCALTMIIQLPVWIALYQSIMLSLAIAPEGMLNLSRYLYNWPIVYASLPLNQNFLGIMNLGSPNFIMAILVGASMWVQQKMSSPTVATDPRQAQQQQLMLWMMPMIFAVFALSFPSGLALYWVANSMIRIVMQYRITGWGGLRRTRTAPDEKKKKHVSFEETMGEKKSTDDVGADIVISDTEAGKGMIKPDKSRYQPGKDRARRRRKR